MEHAGVWHRSRKTLKKTYPSAPPLFRGPNNGDAASFSPPRPETEDICAALDLGTNNCRLMIASRATTGFRVLDSYSKIVRLGEGLHASGELSDVAMQRTLEALHICRNRLERHKPARVRAVATEACRRALNGRTFIERIFQETGIRFDIISAREEAVLAVESCAALLQGKNIASQEWGLLLDIGGGSTEVAWVQLDPYRQRHRLAGYVSLPVGVITLAEQFSERQPDAYRAMVECVSVCMQEFEQAHDIQKKIGDGKVRVVGTSGTVTTLASLNLDLPRYIRSAVDGYCLPPEGARNAIARLHRMGIEGMRVHPCIGTERAHYVMPGCAIFEAFLSLWPANITVADRGLRDGLLLRMMQDKDSASWNEMNWKNDSRSFAAG